MNIFEFSSSLLDMQHAALSKAPRMKNIITGTVYFIIGGLSIFTPVNATKTFQDGIFKELKGYRLFSNIFLNTEETSSVRCLYTCLKNPEWLSLNVVRKATSSLYLCELSNSNHITSKKELKATPEFVHFTVQVGKVVIPYCQQLCVNSTQ